ncbi:MAG TPA: amylo-alpha-1,6-glucosidase [Verrucomicrobiae bacterium]|nr:amylo-alpha-1,6-glucosidase [Verrucomicrobiae bacterium]
MRPAPGEHRQRFVGDAICFTLQEPPGSPPAPGWRALLRTNLGRAAQLRQEIVQAHAQGLPLAGASWRDVPMRRQGTGWSLELPLTEVGFFQAKAYLVDPQGWQHWPEGPNVGISVHPDRYRTANVIYCAFARLFGASRGARQWGSRERGSALTALDLAGAAALPPSGKLRDVLAQLPHIFDTLGCRILHLLPVHPTPTTYARFGRMGSPYAALDLTAIDPALVVFDRKTTGVDQFRELAYAVHLRGGRLLLDIVINHTGWGSVLQESHPEWFVRNADGAFASPGAWGVTWEDLVELRHQNLALWDRLAEVFLIWCRRGADGFRCDAGYKVPVPAWQYIIARVQQEYPEAVFLLEGLGGAWTATAALLTEGGMQWAYSELFQNYSGREVAGYLAHSLEQSPRVGLLVHYSETHDNERLAARGRAWSLLRNRLCALASVSGGFGFTCGVEWLAAEKIRVHDLTGLAWGNPENLLPELANLNRLLNDHPCFADGARIWRLGPSDSPVLALLRQSAEANDHVLVLVNTDERSAQSLSIPWPPADSAASKSPPDLESSRANEALRAFGQRNSSTSQAAPWHELLGQALPSFKDTGSSITFTLPAAGAYCLSPTAQPQGLPGPDYRRARAQAAFALTALGQVLPLEDIGRLDWRQLAARVDQSAVQFLADISNHGEGAPAYTALGSPAPVHSANYAPVVMWTMLDVRRITPVPPGHWLLLQDTVAFRASLRLQGAPTTLQQNLESIPVGAGHIACFPAQPAADAVLWLERYAEKETHLEASLRFLPAGPVPRDGLPPTDARVLLTNGRGGMARMCVDLGRVLSKYDCVLGANLHPTLPVDRHILAKRIRVWVSADGFISPLDFRSLVSFRAGPPAVWDFVANAGDGRTVEIQMTAEMPLNRNTTVFRFSRPSAALATGKQLPPAADVRLTVRIDIEDRNFHWETHRNSGAEHHFATNTRALTNAIGFGFTPAADRQLRVFADTGAYHLQPEWSENIPHPVEQSRGQVGSGDGFSPGWFEIPLPKGAAAKLVVTAEAEAATAELVSGVTTDSRLTPASVAPAHDAAPPAATPDWELFREELLEAVRAFVVRRGTGKTVIAGYPWFLDWGRDTFICARGLLAAGWADEVSELANTFARFEKDGTLPNTIFGEDASNRDTSDAPLWFGLVCEELSALRQLPTAASAALESIARHYASGTPNGIRLDPESGLVWSPSHFTWMDTNYPACTPREGYPIELQALWVRLLRFLAGGAAANSPRWQALANQAQASLEKLFWSESQGWFGDVLLAGPGQPASKARLDDALRSNCLLPVSLGVVRGERARRCVEAAQRYLVIPGALRSLAPLPVNVPLPIRGPDGRLLNNPLEPYWGRYEGDEDTRRKPAYHNGTGWTWTLPIFCEALARVWDFAPQPVAAARAYLATMARLMDEGCLGQIPELLDGDAPHTPRGCDAQAWGATEALRVLALLSRS